MARHTPGNYVPLDVNYPHDRAIREAGTNAELLFVRSLAYVKRTRSGGFVPDYDLQVVAVGMRSVPAAVASLVKVALWVKVDGGWSIRSWERWNNTDKAVSAGGKLGNHKRWHEERGVTDSDCDLCADRPPIAPRSLPDSLPESPPRIAREGKGREVKASPEAPAAPPLRTVAEIDNAGQVMGLWLESLTRRPPSAVVGQIAKQVKTLLADKFTPQEIIDGLNAWQAKGLHPSTLPSVVNETINKPKRPTYTDEVRQPVSKFSAVAK